jgi:RNA polymerase sigma-70 factor (ECF subfamily)
MAMADQAVRPAELTAHCYRLLGSVSDSLAIVDATSGRDDPIGAATTEALALLGRNGRRRLPTSFGGPSAHPEGELSQHPEVLWLEPLPDRLAPGVPRVGLEFVTGLQHLPPRARTVLVLRDVQGWPADRVGGLLGIDPGAAEHALADARTSLDRVVPRHELVTSPDLLARYAAAFERYDVPAIESLFAPDAVWEMPPFTSWFRGARAIGRLISTHCPAEAPGDQVLVPVEANGQPGFAVYMRDPGADVHRAFQIQLLTITAAGVAHAVAFFDLSLFASFDLPQLLTDLSDSAALRPQENPAAAKSRRS